MNVKAAFKLVILMTALTATVCAIILLKQGHMDSFWASLGIDRGGNRLNWCEERVTELFVFPRLSGNDQVIKLYERDGEWRWKQGDNDLTLDYLRVEKWFAKYCLLKFQKTEKMPTAMPQALFEAQFLGGGRLALKTVGGAVYNMRDQYFRSETLQQALKELLAFGEKIE